MAKSIISSTQVRGVSLDLRLSVPTRIIISSGFLRSSGLILSFISSVVQPGKDDTFIREFFDILWSWRCLRIESPAIIISFRPMDCICSGSLGDSIHPGRLLSRFLCEQKGLLLFLSSLFVL